MYATSKPLPAAAIINFTGGFHGGGRNFTEKEETWDTVGGCCYAARRQTKRRTDRQTDGQHRSTKPRLWRGLSNKERRNISLGTRALPSIHIKGSSAEETQFIDHNHRVSALSFAVAGHYESPISETSVYAATLTIQRRHSRACFNCYIWAELKFADGTKYAVHTFLASTAGSSCSWLVESEMTCRSPVQSQWPALSVLCRPSKSQNI